MVPHPSPKIDSFLHIRIPDPVIAHQDGAVIFDIDTVHLTPCVDSPQHRAPDIGKVVQLIPHHQFEGTLYALYHSLLTFRTEVVVGGRIFFLVVWYADSSQTFFSGVRHLPLRQYLCEL